MYIYIRIYVCVYIYSYVWTKFVVATAFSHPFVLVRVKGAFCAYLTFDQFPILKSPKLIVITRAGTRAGRILNGKVF